MAYIGNQPTSVAFLTDQFSGNGSTTAFTLSAAPANTNSILVAISGVLQDPSTYSISGTTLTFSPAPPTGTGNISVRFLGIPASGVTTTAYRTVTEFTATAGQTTFTPPSYTVGYINVYRNGALLGTADYTASNGTTFVLANPASLSDLVVVESFYVSSVLNAIPAVANAVTTSYINSGAVTAAKMAASGAWAPTGTVIQVVNFTTTTPVSVSNSTFVDTTLTATITPKFATSNILVLVSQNGMRKVSGQAADDIAIKLLRNSTLIAQPAFFAAYTATSLTLYGLSCSLSYLDSPGITSAIVYKTQIANPDGSGAVTTQGNNENSTITLLEIAG